MKENKQTAERLKYLQSLPLDAKIATTVTRIGEWYRYWGGNVYVSFSGGKDSTVLLDLVRKEHPEVKAVYSDTGLEYPEIRQFVKTFDNVDIVRPEMRFDEAVTQYGYPLIGKEVAQTIYYARRIIRNVSVERPKPTIIRAGEYYQYEHKKRDRYRLLGINHSQFSCERWLPIVSIPAKISNYCCYRMKKQPMHRYEKQSGLLPILATMATESRLRKQQWIRTGCNAFDGDRPKSTPMSFWTEQDVLRYIVDHDIQIAAPYGDIVVIAKDGFEYSTKATMGAEGHLKCTGCSGTGCIFCAFGAHLEKGETRFQRLAKTHPRQYEYCIGGGKWADNPEYDPTAPKMDGDWENWNPKKIWVPSEKGLGMGKVFDMANEIYGRNFIRYD